METTEQETGTTLDVFGVPYTHVRTEDGGDLWLTEYGLPLAEHLKPSQWFADRYYIEHGERLAASTGTVYRVQPKGATGRCMIVAKFSRVGQEVPLVIEPDFPDDLSESDISGVRFNSPWEEFGLVMELRRGGYGAPDLTLRTQKPLGIYAPPEQFELWRLGRTDGRFSSHRYSLKQDQSRHPLAVELDIKRDYLVLYGWIHGIDAVMARSMGLITESQLGELTGRVVGELKAKGFRVLDNKPAHFILRIDPDTGEIIRRHGKLLYAMVDYELMQRTAACQQTYRDRQREHYFKALAGRASPRHGITDAQHTRIMGVDYIFGHSPNGGMVWVVGDNPDLLDYFQPDRCRRTPRVKLSLGGEVYRTRSRDDIHIVYRLSRVGQRPNADPFYGHGKRTREYGYNSPFEEIAIAEKLRSLGIQTVHPRAIYRTAHETSRARHLRDPSRYLSHTALTTPSGDPEPILNEHHDYYTIWGQWRGIDPLWLIRPRGRWGFIDADRALTRRLVTAQEMNQTIAGSRRQLVEAGCDESLLNDHQFLFILDSEGNLSHDKSGNHEVALAFDALTALDYGLVSEDTYCFLVDEMAGRLKRAGFEALTLTGSHLLLSFDTRGNLRINDKGERETALCSFDSVTPIDQNGLME